MLNTLIALALAGSRPMASEPRIVSASLFKNGYAVIVREMPLANGETIIDVVPQAALGTLWITASKGAKISELVSQSRETTTEAAAGTIDEVLKANVGNTVVLVFEGGGFDEAKILGANQSVVIIESEGQVRVVQKAQIKSVRSSGKSQFVWKTQSKSSERVYRVKARAPAGAKLYLVSLERGLTWSPAYAADITDPKALLLTARATVLNDIGDLSQAEVRLVTGFPNMPFLNVLDPFSLNGSVDQFTAGLMSLGTPDRFRREPGMMMQQNAGLADSFEGTFGSGVASTRREDLFFYSLPNVNLKRGERGYFVLFEMSSPYSHVYEWEVNDPVQEERYVYQSRQGPEDVWHSVKFVNKSEYPLTTGVAITMQGGEILGQDMISFTNPGADTSLRITKALDVIAESAEEEVSRIAKRIGPDRGEFGVFELTVKGTLSVRSLKDQPIVLNITKRLTGELLSADDKPDAVKLATGLMALNPQQRLRWTIPLKARESKTGTYTYKVLVRS